MKSISEQTHTHSSCLRYGHQLDEKSKSDGITENKTVRKKKMRTAEMSKMQAAISFILTLACVIRI